MKKFRFVVASLAAATCISSVYAGDVKFNEVGLGYNGMYLGEIIQGVSVRTWSDKVGLEANVGHLGVGDDDTKYNLYLVSGKVMYAPVQHPNSKFYIGLEVGGGGITNSGGDSMDGYYVRPLFGSEYRFSEMKELGFNWEVGWTHSTFGSDGYDVDLQGTSVSVGIHYYF